MTHHIRYSPEVRERAVRVVFDHNSEYDSQRAAIVSIATKIGCCPETLSRWFRQTEVDTGRRGGLASNERDRIKELERENRELRQTNEILRLASAFLGTGGARPQTKMMVSFIDEQREVYGVEPICRALLIAPSSYYERKARQADPARLPLRVKRDETLRPEIQRVYDENFQVYGAHKIWQQLSREGISIIIGRQVPAASHPPPMSRESKSNQMKPERITDRISH